MERRPTPEFRQTKKWPWHVHNFGHYSMNRTTQSYLFEKKGYFLFSHKIMNENECLNKRTISAKISSFSPKDDICIKLKQFYDIAFIGDLRWSENWFLKIEK